MYARKSIDKFSGQRKEAARQVDSRCDADLPMRRVLSNIEIEAVEEPVKSSAREYRVGANFVLYELRAQSTHKLEVWPGRVEYRLRAGTDGEFKMFFKKVMLVHGSEPLSTLGFII